MFFHLIILLNVRLVDLPLLEDYPLVWVDVFWDKFLKERPSNIPIASYLELWQCFYEGCYQQCTTSYELYIFEYLRQIPISKYWLIWNLYFLVVLYMSFYIWRFNITFVIGSWMLPVVFYYFFVLTDYLEAIEELLKYIKSIEKTRS